VAPCAGGPFLQPGLDAGLQILASGQAQDLGCAAGHGDGWCPVSPLIHQQSQVGQSHADDLLVVQIPALVEALLQDPAGLARLAPHHHGGGSVDPGPQQGPRVALLLKDGQGRPMHAGGPGMLGLQVAEQSQVGQHSGLARAILSRHCELQGLAQVGFRGLNVSQILVQQAPGPPSESQVPRLLGLFRGFQ